jgi:glycosyltransferase involved in cell wall biosynthesis
LKGKLEENARHLGLQDQVRFLGRISPVQVPDLLRDVDVMVVSSHYETFGLVAAEALMCGTPVVATRCGGPECIVQEGDGLLVPVGDIDQLSNALARMVDLLPTINSADIAERAWQRFSADAVGAQLEEVYAGLKTDRNKPAATQ